MPRASRSIADGEPAGGPQEAKPRPSRKRTASGSSSAAGADAQAVEVAADLRYGEARAALELVLGQLQASDLDVEAMADLYRRGLAYLQRCEAVLQQVEQQVLIWDGLEQPDQPPQPLNVNAASSAASQDR